MVNTIVNLIYSRFKHDNNSLSCGPDKELDMRMLFQ